MLKKAILVGTMVLIFVTTVHSQSLLGLKGGVNLANLSGTSMDADLDYRVAPVFGLLWRNPLNEMMAFQPEFLYSMRGASWSESGTIDGVRYHEEIVAKYAYFEVPLMFKFYMVKGLNVQMGPQFGLILFAEEEYNGRASNSSSNLSVSETKDVLDRMKPVEFGLIFGIGYDLDSGIGLDVRYNHGMSNIVDSENYDLYNRGFQVTASYSF